MSATDVVAYLGRIGYRGPVAPTAAVLRALQVAHLRSVPFENLDIHLGRPIVLDERALFDKIVRRRRGGFCFELNGLFAALLRAVGFRVDLLAAQMPRDPGRIAPEFDHLTLLVWARDGAEPWLADVGAGDSFVAPLRAATDAEQADPESGSLFRLEPDGAGRRLLRRRAGGAWEPSYRFSLRPRSLPEFEVGSRYHQTSPDSHFTRRRVCSLLTATGRITLSDGRLIATVDGERTERPLAGEAEERAILRDCFGIVLDGDEGAA